MQHHSRPAPHMQRSHHMASNAANPSHVPILNMVGTLPQQQTNQHQAAAQAAHPKQQHHLSNGPPPPNAVAGAPLQPQQMRNRLSHQQQQHHQQSQMQKIRQQHQHLNNNTHKNNQQHPQQQPQYSNANVPQQQKQHMAGLQQQQRNMPHHHQQQHPHVPHMKNHSQHSAGNNTLAKQQILTSAITAAQQTQPQPHYYAANKTKYNNNSTTTATTNYTAPKSILQNPNRSLKSKVQIAPTINEDVATVADTATTSIADIPKLVSCSNNITIIPEASPITPVVSAAAALSVDVVAAENMAGTIALAETLKISNMIEGQSADTKKENTPLDEVTSESDELPGTNALNGCSGSNNILSNEDTSASKNSNEKTPMCLVNELARFNKITHQYRLTSEEGPPHCKCFTVTLKLGDEEYAAEGFKIKKAQHMAATMAIEKTKYKHPLRKTNRRSEDSSYRTNITPTVELNALAMKLGQQTYYLFDPRQMPPADGSPGDVMMPPFGVPPGPLGGHLMPHSRMMDPSYMRRGGGAHGGFGPPPPPNMPHLQHQHPRFGAQQRGGYPSKFMQRFPPMMVPPPPGQAHNGIIAARFCLAPRTTCKITLIVGKQKFVGIGRTLQQAKHDAASRALQVLKTQATNQFNEMLNQSLDESINKSPVSLVHEIGIKRSLTVHFKVVREDGPAHMKNFVTHCIVGDIVTEGEGNGKKISKKRAAQRMLKELKNLPPLTPTRSPVKRVKTKTPNSRSGGAGGNSNATPDGKPVERRKRTGGSSIKDKTADDDADSENPITKLIQLQQNLKEKEPVFELIAKNGNELSYRREFIIEVSAQGKVARGIGSTKKFAKRNAAQNLLSALGYAEPEVAPNPQKEVSQLANNSKAATASAPAGVDTNSSGVLLPDSTNTAPAPTSTKIDEVLDVPLITTSAGQVPGILILRQNKKHATKKKEITANAAPLEKRNKESKKKEEPTKGKITTSTENNVTTSTATVVESSEETATNITPSVTSTAQSAASNTTRNTVQTADTAISTPTPATVSNTSTSVATAAPTPSSSSGSSSVSLHMKDQLLYLAKLLGFDVDFSDYPKGNHNDFLTIVTLTTNPSQICHGVGTSSEESQNDAARNALKILSELGLNNAKK